MADYYHIISIFIFMVNYIQGLEICEDHYVSCPANECGQYPLEPLYRLHCMKTCGVCTDVNRALSKPTGQSSTVDNRLSGRAVDGSIDLKLCTSTNSSQTGSQWWYTDLQQIYEIDSIKIYSPISAHESLSNFQVNLGLSGPCNEAGFGSSTLCYISPHADSKSVYTVTECNGGSNIPMFARCVYISIPNQDSIHKPLVLCEVGIFTGTKCSAGYYSYNATTCVPCETCAENSCEVDTGMCWDGCKQGFQGQNCNQCVDGLFGKTCRFACNTTRCQSNCDRETGMCTECDVGYYGSNCQLQCNDNCRGGTCVKSDGSCSTEEKELKVTANPGEEVPNPPTSSSVNKYLVGAVGVFIGISITCVIFMVYRCMKKSKKSKTSYTVETRPPSKRELDFPMDPNYIMSGVSTTSSRYTEVLPETGSDHGSHYPIRNDLSPGSSQYSYKKRPPAELPENERRRLHSQLETANRSSRQMEYRNHAYDKDDTSDYEAIRK